MRDAMRICTNLIGELCRFTEVLISRVSKGHTTELPQNFRHSAMLLIQYEYCGQKMEVRTTSCAMYDIKYSKDHNARTHISATARTTGYLELLAWIRHVVLRRADCALGNKYRNAVRERQVLTLSLSSPVASRPLRPTKQWKS